MATYVDCTSIFIAPLSGASDWTGLDWTGHTTPAVLRTNDCIS